MPVKHRDFIRCPVCGRAATQAALDAGARGVHKLEIRTCWFHGGGRAGRPRVQAVDDDGQPLFTADGEPKMVLLKVPALDADGQPVKKKNGEPKMITATGPGMRWSRRDLTDDERDKLVITLRDVANRISAELAEDVLLRVSRREFDSLSNDYIEAGQRELDARKALIAKVAQQRKRHQ